MGFDWKLHRLSSPDADLLSIDYAGTVYIPDRVQHMRAGFLKKGIRCKALKGEK